MLAKLSNVDASFACNTMVEIQASKVNKDAPRGTGFTMVPACLESGFAFLFPWDAFRNTTINEHLPLFHLPEVFNVGLYTPPPRCLYINL